MRNQYRNALMCLLLAGPWTVGASAQTPVMQSENPALADHSLTPSDSAGSGRLRSHECILRVRSLQSRASRRFSSTRILDLDFHVHLDPRQTGDRLVRIELETPGGHLFQTLIVPFSDDPTRAGTRRAIPGFARPVEVQPMQEGPRRGRRALKTVVGRLPVAGTSIVHSSLYGRWTARAYFDDDIEPCGRARSFILRP